MLIRLAPFLGEKIQTTLKHEGRASVLILIGLLVFVYHIVSLSGPVGPHLSVGGSTILLDVADTEQERERGLGGRKGMAQNRGMLFVFDAERTDLCFWMKNMQFAIDIIWMDSAKKVVYIAPNLSPNTYPNTFCPPKPARYVVELNAGAASGLKIHTGQKLDFAV